MITIHNQPQGAAPLLNEYPKNSVESIILTKLESSGEAYAYDSINQLKFELKLRREIINAANSLYRSRMSFETFRHTTSNPHYWVRMDDGGFALKEGVKPSDAIRDIFVNSEMYGTECATAMLIIYYKALLEVFPEDAFNKMFPNIYLMNWHRIEKNLEETGLMRKTKVFLPGDRLYFANPDVDPLTPQWQGENVIDMGDGLYYGHGIGKYKADTFIKTLNQHRKADADETAYLMDFVGRPNFQHLAALYDTAISGVSTLSYSA